ncbi:hypothetical protein IMCC3317_44530 [Kordia antarctica]|uniref:Uncharacterized protein n=1 Tax=Kordia antarctica TaxID=1218801 RepID=A0A7L4ZR16_9FLAO|nr:hypothetical protein [Kordia antarctica]QHI39052.1 hypothetical protein IMCC3317_44530 [Kordia antarctica]
MTEFIERYKKLSDKELLAIIANASSYTSIALEAAKQELIARGISPDHLAELETQNIIDTKEKEALLQKRKVERERSKTDFFTLFITVNPFLKQLASHERLIRIMSWIFTVISIYVIFVLVYFIKTYGYLFTVNQYEIGEYFDYQFSRYGIGTSYLLLCLVYIISIIPGTILFWKRKRLGWVLTTFYMVSVAVGLFFLLLYYTTKPGYQFNRMVDEFMMSDLPMWYSLYIAFLVFCLYVLFKGKVKNVFKIKKGVGFLIVILAIIFQVLLWYPFITLIK